MGIYCSVIIPIKCPKCGALEERECQTKDLNSFFLMDVWRAGDSILADIPHELQCIASCDKPTCGTLKTINGKSYVQAWHFNVVVRLDNGVITGEYEAFEGDPESP
jgi:hypothetical protein